MTRERREAFDKLISDLLVADRACMRDKTSGDLNRRTVAWLALDAFVEAMDNAREAPQSASQMQANGTGGS